mgnify:CR=1 FL=1
MNRHATRRVMALMVVLVFVAFSLIAAQGGGAAKWLGLAAVVMASINIFGGFAVTGRMLAMYRKKAR